VGALVACAEPAMFTLPSESEPLDDLPTEVEDVLSDFVAGANLPWLNYGHDFGQAWGDFGVRSAKSAPRLARDFDALVGADVVRWFVYADGRALDTSTPDEVLADLEAALQLADARGIALMPVLFDFYWFDAPEIVDGVQLFGRRRLATDEALRRDLVDRWVAPLAARYGDDPRIFAFEIINEPEWAMSDGPRAPIVDEPITVQQMGDFVFDVAAALRGGRPLTVGSASFDDLQQLWLDAPLDLLQLHDYGRGDLPPAADLDTDIPVLVGELATVDTDLTARMETYEALGYAGALPWSLNGEDGATSRSALEAYFGNRVP